MPVFDEKHEELDHYETMMGVPRGRLAVTMDMITDAMALVGQHGVYCQSQRWPPDGKRSALILSCDKANVTTLPAKAGSF